MSDVALVMIGDGTEPRFDFALKNGDLVLDDTLYTPVILSLGTDRLAETDDKLPDEDDTDRRGWWGDTPLTTEDETDLSGSRLWLLERAKALTATATKARHYITEALQWMLTDGVVKTIDVQTQWNAPEFLAISLKMAQTDATGRADKRYDLIWKATL